MAPIQPEDFLLIQALGPVWTLAELRQQGQKCNAPWAGSHCFRKWIKSLLAQRLILNANKDVWRMYGPRFVDIESTTSCNARCVFCPVSSHPLPPAEMNIEQFQAILQKLKPLHLEWVSLNHYNEPLLDRAFLSKVQLLKQAGLKLWLFTNGILLQEKIIQALASLGNTYAVSINLPSPDPIEYEQLMGIAMHPKLLQHVQAAAAAGIRVYVCVNGPKEQSHRNKKLLDQLFQNGSHCGVYAHFSHNRAGWVQNSSVFQPLHWDGPLFGCQRMFEHLHINHQGQVFLCCQDYDQKYILGDLMQQSVHEILAGDIATHLRQQIFGNIVADPNFICRFCVELCRG